MRQKKTTCVSGDPTDPIVFGIIVKNQKRVIQIN